MNEKNTPGVPGQEIDPSAENTNPATEPEGDLLAEIEASDNAVIASLPNVERAAFKRELMSALSRATWAAERLADLTPEVAAPITEPEPEEEAPITEPQRLAGRSLAMLSDGSVAISLAYLEGADLAGRTRWEGIILSPEEAEEALDGMSDAADDVAANIGGSLIWRKKGEPEGSGGDENV
jgi:hypothetical protein